MEILNETKRKGVVVVEVKVEEEGIPERWRRQTARQASSAGVWCLCERERVY